MRPGPVTIAQPNRAELPWRNHLQLASGIMAEVVEATVVVEELGPAQFGAVDYIVFILLVVVSMGIGVYSALRNRGNSSTQEYLLGGGQMPLLPVTLSLIGGVVSALSILGNATEMYFYGTQLSMNLLGCVIGTFLVQVLIIPVICQLQMVSMMQYLEMRFHSTALRKIGTLCQLIAMFFFLGICLYAPSLALSSVTSLPTWASVVVMGFICTIYVTIGGVKAVVYTDVIQTMVMLFGVLAVVIQCIYQLGGFQAVWHTSQLGNRIEFFNMDPSPFVRHTVWSTPILGIYFIISVVGLSQPQYQRCASLKNTQERKWLLRLFIVGLLLLWGLFYLSGLVAYATYSKCDPLTSGKITKADQIIPYLVMDKLGHMQGMGGLFVAAVYGGVLSSMSSQANSIACIIWEDFLKDQPYFKTFSNTAATNTVKLLSAVTGILSVGCGLLSGQLGSLFNVAYSINGALKGPLDGVFLTGILVPWANKKGALAGLIISFTFNMWLVIGKFIQGGGTPPYLPLSTEGCLVNGSHPLLINSTTAYSFPNSPTTTVPSSYTSTGINPVASTHNPQIEAIDVSSTSHTIYDISYCYSGIMGVIITMVISSLVSLCTGPVAPKNVNKKLVNLTCARLHHQLWQLLPNHDSYSNDMEDKVAPNLTTSASIGLDDVQQLTKKQTGSREDYPNL